MDDVRLGLAAAGCRVEILLPHDQAITPHDVHADLVVHRGLNAAASELVAELDARGMDICPPPPRVAEAGRRSNLRDHLDDQGVPVPGAFTVHTWEEALTASGGGPQVVKSEHGGGRGREVVALGGGRVSGQEHVETPTDGADPAAPAPFEGPYLVEEFIPNDGFDHKLYVAGRSVWGLLKPSSLIAPHVLGDAGKKTGDSRELRLTPEEIDLALMTARVTGLHLLGLDVVHGTNGPVVVDVNVFPWLSRH